MNIFIVYYHPEPRSFNGALLEKARSVFEEKGHNLRISDLHQRGFNPVSGRHNFTTIDNANYYKQQFEELNATEKKGFSQEIAGEIDNMFWCDMMIWQFPLWWFGLPAPMKGWVDRVFAMGKVYGNGRFYDNGVFQGKRALLSLTTGGTQEAYLEDGFNGDIYGILRPIHRGILEFVGYTVLHPHIVYGSSHLTEEERTILLDRYGRRLENIDSERPMSVGRYG